MLPRVADGVEQAGQDRGDVGLAQPLVGEVGDRVAQLVVAQHVGQAAQRGAELLAQAPGVRRIGQPLPQSLGHLRGRHPFADDLGGEEVLLDEAGQPLADLVLLVRDDRGVRDPQLERVAEQGRHREPVGQAADHRGLGRGLEVPPRAPAVAEGAAEDVDDGRGQQQAAGDQLHPPQRAHPLERHRRDRRAEIGGAHARAAIAAAKTPAGSSRPKARNSDGSVSSSSTSTGPSAVGSRSTRA